MVVNLQAPVQASSEVFVEAPPEIVWSALADIESWPLWNSGIARTHLHGPMASGTRFSWKAGGMSIESRLIAVSKPSLLAWTGKTTGTRAIHVSRFSAEGEGTRAVTEESFEGFLPRLLRGYMRKILIDSLASGLEALKRESERRAQVGAA